MKILFLLALAAAGAYFYMNFYKNADPAVKKEIAAGIDKLKDQAAKAPEQLKQAKEQAAKGVEKVKAAQKAVAKDVEAAKKDARDAAANAKKIKDDAQEALSK